MNPEPILPVSFQILAFNYAIFAGVACFILAGAVRRLGRDRD